MPRLEQEPLKIKKKKEIKVDRKCKKKFAQVLDELRDRVIKDQIHVEKDPTIVSWILNYLDTLPQPAQRTPEWYEYRKNKLTASDAASPLTINQWYIDNAKKQNFSIPYSKRNVLGECCTPYPNSKELDLLMKKCGIGEPFTGNQYTEHGKKYERVAIQKYEKLYNIQVREYGVIPHPTIDWLGASPDGITTAGVMLEIKCPYSNREIGIPALYYWIQMQIQMECCNLDEADFLDCRIREYTSKEEYDQDKETEDKGVIIEIVDVDNGNIVENIYVPFGQDVDQWVKDWYIQEATKRPSMWFSGSWRACFTYWHIADYRITRIKRCREWFAMEKPRLRAFWKRVLHYRKHLDKLEKLAIDSKRDIYDADGKLRYTAKTGFIKYRTRTTATDCTEKTCDFGSDDEVDDE